MEIDVAAEKHGLRFSCIISTMTLDTHSAMQQVSKEDIELLRTNIRRNLEIILDMANTVRKK